MARASFQVVTYWYYNWSSRKSHKTSLILTGAAGERCFVSFEEDDTAELQPAREIAPSAYYFYYHHNQLQHLIDMLRYEKPIYVHFNNDQGFNNSRISTTHEPVGEGEES